MSLDCNRAYCEFMFDGEANALRLFLNSIRGGRPLEHGKVPPVDFNKIIQPPEPLDQWYADANEEARRNWCREHWGCSGNGYYWMADESFQPQPSQGSAQYILECDSTPLKIIEELIRKCNEKNIQIAGYVFYAVNDDEDGTDSIDEEWFEEEEPEESYSFPGTIQFSNDGIQGSDSDDVNPADFFESLDSWDSDLDLEWGFYRLKDDWGRSEDDGEDDDE